MYPISLILLVILLPGYSAFMIGKCIGPRRAFERYLSFDQKHELTELVENTFDGTNKEFVMYEIFKYLKTKLTVNQWNIIWPEVEYHTSLDLPCSPYSSILPPAYYKPLSRAVRNAGKLGTSRKEIKRLVDEYLDRILMDPTFQKETAHRFDYLRKEQVLLKQTSLISPLYY
uniref:Uncharacterized protein n=1 Tax=Rhabditophanes sp. KR3021 TaxID=114890 RepID=A0AC35U1H2_9BILA